MKIKIKCQKTIQEDNFEPILYSCEIEEEVKDHEMEDKLKELRNNAQEEVKKGMNQWLT